MQSSPHLSLVCDSFLGLVCALNKLCFRLECTTRVYLRFFFWLILCRWRRRVRTNNEPCVWPGIEWRRRGGLGGTAYFSALIPGLQVHQEERRGEPVRQKNWQIGVMASPSIHPPPRPTLDRLSSKDLSGELCLNVTATRLWFWLRKFNYFCTQNAPFSHYDLIWKTNNIKIVWREMPSNFVATNGTQFIYTLLVTGNNVKEKGKLCYASMENNYRKRQACYNWLEKVIW